MAEPTSEQVQAALAAYDAYTNEIASLQSAKSREIYGHGGAHISTIPWEPTEAMRRALAAAFGEENA